MRYKNNGKYDSGFIDKILDEWCDIAQFNKKKASHFTPEFLDDIWELCWEMATGGRVQSFLLKAWDDRQTNGHFRQYQACCLLKTYQTLLREVEKAERYRSYYG